MEKRHLIISGLYLLFHLLLFSSACANDELPVSESPAYCDTITVATYDNGIKNIIDGGCAYSGCHDGAGGIGPGDYSNYDGFYSLLVNGEFRKRVITEQDDPVLGMPPDPSVYAESQGGELPEEEFRALVCWLDAGYPEN